MFDDNYRDTGVPLISRVSTRPATSAARRWPIPSRTNLHGGVGFRNTPRVHVDKDHTKRAYGQVDYIQSINAEGKHNLKAGFGVQHTSNAVDISYPGGGYVFIWWDRAFASRPRA